MQSKFKSCLQPWGKNWVDHRVIGYVKLHSQMHDYLGIDIHSGNEIEEFREYPRKGIAKKIEIYKVT